MRWSTSAPAASCSDHDIGFQAPVRKSTKGSLWRGRRSVPPGTTRSYFRVPVLPLHFLAGENETALSAIDRAIVLNPNAARAFSLRALVLVFLNRPDEAIPAAQEAMRLEPRGPWTFLSVQAQAFAHLAAGRYEAGLPFADRALRENGGLPALRFKLSLCGHLGRLDEAKECLRLLHELHPEPTVASVMRDVSRGVDPEIVARMAEGLCKAGVPEIRSPAGMSGPPPSAIDLFIASQTPAIFQSESVSAEDAPHLRLRDDFCSRAAPRRFRSRR